MIEVEDGRAHELRVGRVVYRVAADDARDLVYYNNVLGLFASMGAAMAADTVELAGADGVHELRLPAELDVRPVDGPEPALQWTLGLTEAASRILSLDLDRSEERQAHGLMDPDRVCPRCGARELEINVVDDWLGLAWWCPACRFEKPAWPLPT